MTVREISSKTEWEDFLIQTEPHSFLPSWNWGDLQERLGTTVLRVGVYDGSVLLAVTLILHIKARRGAFLFVPHGPILKLAVEPSSVLPTLLEFLKEHGKKRGVAFIRLSPLLEKTEKYRFLFRRLGFRDAPVHLMHPELAWLLDIRKDEEVLIKEMRKTTRYLIRKAEKEGVVIREGDSEDDLAAFLKVYRTTVDRQSFRPFKDDFFKNELEVFKNDRQIKIFLAEHEGNVIGAAMIVFYGQSAFYHHGASDQTYSHIPGSYLLQWRVIQAARARGLTLYNFWGIVRPDGKKHPWAGLSLFKTGFGGFEEEYLHAQDFSLSFRYWLVYFVEKFRRIRRGL